MHTPDEAEALIQQSNAFVEDYLNREPLIKERWDNCLSLSKWTREEAANLLRGKLPSYVGDALFQRGTERLILEMRRDDLPEFVPPKQVIQWYAQKFSVYPLPEELAAFIAPEKSQEPKPTPTEVSAAAKNLRNAPRPGLAAKDRAYREAVTEALALWESGDKRKHYVMANYLEDKYQAQGLKKDRLKTELKAALKEINRLDLIFNHKPG